MPSSATRIFTDPDMYFAGIRNLQIDGVVTKRGEFCAEVDAHRPASAVDASHRREPASDHEDNAERKAVGDPLQQQSPSAGDAGQRDRSIARSNTNVRVEIGHTTSRSSEACGWGTMSLTPEDLAAISEAIIGHPLIPPSFPRWTKPPAPVVSRLLRLHEAAGHLAKTAPDILAKPEVARAIEEALVEAMILCLTEGHSDNVRNVHRHRTRVMRRLEEVLTSTPDRPLYMPQLCATVGASYTTLHDCCQEYLGMSPKRYLWLRRMHLVLCFRNNVPMASGCIIDFVPPGVDDWLAIDVADEGHQAFPEFVFGGDADVAQH